MGWKDWLFSPKRPEAPEPTAEVRTIDWSFPAGSAPSAKVEAVDGAARPYPQGASVLIDPPDGPAELAEIRPIGVVVPRNKQELIEELRKNYTEVIDLVRKVNVHLDDQGSRLAEQEARGRELMEIARQVPTLLQVLPKLQEQNGRMIELVAQMSQDMVQGNDGVRGAIADHADRSASAADRIASILQTTRANLEQGLAAAAEAQRTGAQRLEDSMSQMSGGLDQVRTTTTSMARSMDATREAIEARGETLRQALEQNQKWNKIATIAGIIAVVAAAALAVYIILTSGGPLTT